MYLICLSVLLTLLLPSKGVFVNETDDFTEDVKSNIAQLLLEKKFVAFETALQDLFGGPEGRHIRLKPSYELAMHEILLTQKQDYVVLESVLCDHLLIPQCACQYNTAFLLEYNTLRNANYKDPVHAKLKKLAQNALDKINKNKYSLFVTAFRHVKEVVKIGITFYNRRNTSIVYEIENTDE